MTSTAAEASNSSSRCASCRNLMSDKCSENFIVIVRNRARNSNEYIEHCSAVCGLATVAAYRPGPTFQALQIGFDIYDLRILQHALRGEK